MNQQREDWPRLASYVVSARVRAGFEDRDAFADAIGVTARTLGTLERGKRVGPKTLARIADELHWTPASPQLILAGSEPVFNGGQEAFRERTLAPLHDGVDDTQLTPHLAKVQRILLDAIARTGVADPPAHEVFPVPVPDEQGFTPPDIHADDREFWARGLRVLPSGRLMLDQHERVRMIAMRWMNAAGSASATGLSNESITDCWVSVAPPLMTEGANW